MMYMSLTLQWESTTESVKKKRKKGWVSVNTRTYWWRHKSGFLDVGTSAWRAGGYCRAGGSRGSVRWRRIDPYCSPTANPTWDEVAGAGPLACLTPYSPQAANRGREAARIVEHGPAFHCGQSAFEWAFNFTFHASELEKENISPVSSWGGDVVTATTLCALAPLHC